MSTWALFKLIVALVIFGGALYYIDYDERRSERRDKVARRRREGELPYPALQPPADHRLTKRERHPYAKPLTEMLLTLYEPKHPFLLGVSNLSPSTILGFFNTHPYCRITIHYGWKPIQQLHDTTVHEFAHHVLMTEFPRRYPAHGLEFKTAYSILIDCYNRHYPYIYPDSRYYLKPNKRVESIIINTK